MDNIRIRYTDIIRSIADILKGRFDMNVYDVLEGFPRACFMTDLHISSTERFMSDHIIDDMTLTIYYFPEDEYNNTAENLTMQEDIRDLIFVELGGLIPVNDRLPLEVLEFNSAIVENVLQVKLDMTMNHKIIIEDDRVMDDIEITYNQN